VLVLLLALIAPADATVVSRLGGVYLYDPALFDAGVLQRGVYSRGIIDSRESSLSAGMDLPFYRDFALRLGYTQDMRYGGAPDPVGLDWRMRMPVLESIRYGRLTSSGFYYTGNLRLNEPDASLRPRHEFGLSVSSSRTWRRSHSIHTQAAFTFRERTGDPADAFGTATRFAHLVQIYRPTPGLGITWTVSLSTLEVEWVQFGITALGGEGLLRGGTLGPTLHVTPRIATWSVGLLPTLSLCYGEDSPQLGVGATANLNVTYRPDWE